MSKKYLIANAVYDTIFKYLMEDKEIARALLSAILDMPIIDLDFLPQEVSADFPSEDLQILRFDFKAEVSIANGQTKKILIELQKAKQSLDILRFRQYLGYNYIEKPEPNKSAIPILSIYFLGFKLEHISVPVLKVERIYKDGVTEELLEGRNFFVENLSHDTYIIQLPWLNKQPRNNLELYLSVFIQEFHLKDPHILSFEGELTDPILKKMIMRLKRAISDEQLRRKMDLEDEIERLLQRQRQEAAEMLEKAEKINQETAEMQHEIAEMLREIAEKNPTNEVLLATLQELLNKIDKE